MSSEDDPVAFLNCHGPNVEIRKNGTLAKGHYIVAQGKFMMERPLRNGESIHLEVIGRGNLRIYPCNDERQAVNLLQSRERLPTENALHIRNHAPSRRKIFEILFNKGFMELSCMKQSKEPHRKPVETETPVLIFDILYGDIKITLDDDISFNTDIYSHSEHVKITKHTAQLVHFNPSALCITEECIIKSGTTLRLKATADSETSVQYFKLGLVKTGPTKAMTEIYGTQEFPVPAWETDVIQMDEKFLTLLLTVTNCGLEIRSHPCSHPTNSQMKTISADINASYFLCLQLHNVGVSLWKQGSSLHSHTSCSDTSEYDSREYAHQTKVKAAWYPQGGKSDSSDDIYYTGKNRKAEYSLSRSSSHNEVSQFYSRDSAHQTQVKTLDTPDRRRSSGINTTEFPHDGKGSSCGKNDMQTKPHNRSSSMSKLGESRKSTGAQNNLYLKQNLAAVSKKEKKGAQNQKKFNIPVHEEHGANRQSIEDNELHGATGSSQGAARSPVPSRKPLGLSALPEGPRVPASRSFKPLAKSSRSRETPGTPRELSMSSTRPPKPSEAMPVPPAEQAMPPGGPSRNQRTRTAFNQNHQNQSHSSGSDLQIDASSSGNVNLIVMINSPLGSGQISS